MKPKRRGANTVASDEKRTPILLRAGRLMYVIANDHVPPRSMLPWHDERLDAFIVLPKSSGSPHAATAAIARRLIALPTDWIEVLGPGSEAVHDLVDQISVQMGRQREAGDGHPMTAWHTECDSLSKAARYIATEGHGSSDNKLVMLTGCADALTLFAMRLRAACRALVEIDPDFP
jgi:hypothetical protein